MAGSLFSCVYARTTRSVCSSSAELWSLAGGLNSRPETHNYVTVVGASEYLLVGCHINPYDYELRRIERDNASQPKL
jgi:hypothetical protein